MNNPIPHAGAIHIKVTGDVFQRLPNGDIGPKRVKHFASSKVMYVHGDSIEECEEKVRNKLNELVDDINEQT